MRASAKAVLVGACSTALICIVAVGHGASRTVELADVRGSAAVRHMPPCERARGLARCWAPVMLPPDASTIAGRSCEQLLPLVLRWLPQPPQSLHTVSRDEQCWRPVAGDGPAAAGPTGPPVLGCVPRVRQRVSLASCVPVIPMGTLAYLAYLASRAGAACCQRTTERF
jgi:hypothetical protein